MSTLLLRNGITFLAEDGPGSAAAYYRAWFPSQCMADSIVVREMGFSAVLQGIETGDMVYLPTKAVVLRQPTVDASAAIKEARSNGQRVYIDIDDDVWHLPPYNPAAKTYTLRNMATLLRNMRAVDGIIVPTEALAESVHEVCSTPVEIIPSGIDVTDWPKREPHSGRFRIGWVGTLPYRGMDMAMIAEPLMKVFEQRDDLEFWHIGALPQDNPAVFGADCIRVPWVPFGQLGNQIRNLDLALIPAQSNRFNQSRSPTTGMVIAACAVPFWCSYTTAYTDLFGEALANSIGAMIDDADYRDHIQQAQYMALAKVNRVATGKRYEHLFATH
jgi:hypothetical protein